MRSTARATLELLDAAAEAFADDPGATIHVDALVRRQDEPLRVALAGMTRCGKSTLLHALIAADLSFDTLTEWPQLVTVYRFGPVPRVSMTSADGASVALALDRRGDRVVIVDADLSGAERLEVEWPAPLLGSLSLVDLPGIASVRPQDSEHAARVLVPGGAPREVDAIIYVLRRLHAADVAFLRAMHDSAGDYGLIDTLAVLSRTDEIGAGRIDSLVSASEIADRYRADGVLRSVASGIVPVAGLLARTAATPSSAEFAQLRSLAALDASVRERLLVSADRFTRPNDSVPIPPQDRARLLRRFGLFGIRLSTSMIRTGVRDAATLSRQLVERSGIEALLDLITECMLDRAELLRARTVLLGIRELLRARPPRTVEGVESAIELLEAAMHDLRELRLLADLRNGGVVVPPGTGGEIERLLGGLGTDATARLGLTARAPGSDVRSRAAAAADRWRRTGADPMLDRATVTVCDTVVRSCESVLAALPSDGRRPPRLVAAPEEPVGSG